MTPLDPDEPIHPATAALLGIALWLAIGVRLVATDGLHGVVLYAVLTLWLLGVVFAVYEMLTLPRELDRY